MIGFHLQNDLSKKEVIYRRFLSISETYVSQVFKVVLTTFYTYPVSTPNTNSNDDNESESGENFTKHQSQNDTESNSVRVNKDFMQMVEKKFNSSLAQIENLSIKLSESERNLGHLESDNTHLLEHKARLESEIESIQNRSDIDLKSMQERLDIERIEKEELKQQLESEKSKSFWSRLMGK